MRRFQPLPPADVVALEAEALDPRGMAKLGSADYSPPLRFGSSSECRTIMDFIKFAATLTVAVCFIVLLVNFLSWKSALDQTMSTLKMVSTDTEQEWPETRASLVRLRDTINKVVGAPGGNSSFGDLMENLEKMATKENLEKAAKASKRAGEVVEKIAGSIEDVVGIVKREPQIRLQFIIPDEDSDTERRPIHTEDGDESSDAVVVPPKKRPTKSPSSSSSPPPPPQSRRAASSAPPAVSVPTPL
jgi:hypothetical protein